MITTWYAYGYSLGGPGHWNLTGFVPGRPLSTSWFDETDPLHDFVTRAHAELGLEGPTFTISEFAEQIAANVEGTRGPLGRAAMPAVAVCAAVEISAPGWAWETHAPPGPASLLHPTHPAVDLDRQSPTRYVLVTTPSMVEVDDGQYYDDTAEHEDDRPANDDPRWDWTLDAALATLGLACPTRPTQFWFREGTRD